MLKGFSRVTFSPLDGLLWVLLSTTLWAGSVSSAFTVSATVVHPGSVSVSPAIDGESGRGAQLSIRTPEVAPIMVQVRSSAGSAAASFLVKPASQANGTRNCQNIALPTATDSSVGPTLVTLNY